MNKSLQQVVEFQKAFKCPVLDVPTKIDKERFKLKVRLIQEELDELISAYDIEDEDKSKTGMLDALGDIQYVVNGAVLELGYGHVFDEAFERIHKSNMSKVCDSIDAMLDTVQWYADQDVKTDVEKVMDDVYIVRRRSDGKILKSVQYKPVFLKDLANGLLPE